MVFSGLVIIRPSMEQSTMDSCITGAIRSVLQGNRVKQNSEITKIKRIDSVKRADFALLRIQGKFAVSMKAKTPAMERFVLYENYPSLSSRKNGNRVIRGISLRVIFV